MNLGECLEYLGGTTGVAVGAWGVGDAACGGAPGQVGAEAVEAGEGCVAASARVHDAERDGAHVGERARASGRVLARVRGDDQGDQTWELADGRALEPEQHIARLTASKNR